MTETHALAWLFFAGLFIFAGAALTVTVWTHRHAIIASLLNEWDGPPRGDEPPSTEDAQ